MPQLTARLASAFALALAACSGSHAPPAAPGLGTLHNSDLVALDEPLRVTFAAPLDPASIDERTVAIVAVAGAGAGLAARGSWSLIDGSDGRADTIEFAPALPLGDPVLASGGLQPATDYELRFHGGDGAMVVRTAAGAPLPATIVHRVRTRAGTTAAALFRSDRPGGPRFTGLTVTPRDAHGHWRLGRANEGAELRLDFDQPLDPGLANLPRAPTANARGAIELVYDDPRHGPATWVACDVELVRNTPAGATVALRPRGVLPSAATLRLRLAPELRDLRGEDRAALGLAAETAEVRTEDAYPPQFDALLVDFARDLALGAPDFGEVAAAITGGALRVPDTFPAVAGVGDWTVAAPETILRTDQQTLRYEDGTTRTFAGGVLAMRNLHVAAGAFVRGTGPHPLVLIVDGDARIDGTLSVSGANGRFDERSQYRGPGDVPPPFPGAGSAPFSEHGGPGGPGGGTGGATPNLRRTARGTPGNPPAGGTANGGTGGFLACADCLRGSGGGGGAMAVQGDPWFPTAAGAGTSFVQRSGRGGFGCAGESGAATRTLLGGEPGAPVFADADPANDFWGDAYDPRTRRRLRGELAAPSGGGGGGSGGDHAVNGSCDPGDPIGYIDWRGRDGGGGGGVLIVQVRGTLTISSTGRLAANGGDARGGPRDPWTADVGGGGGGGAGGTIVLMAGRGLVIQAHGETFANRDYDFAVSADGGVNRTIPLLTPTLAGKYPTNGQPTLLPAGYDSFPLGGFGGLGVIQLMVPIGTDNLDGTNTVLDDAITIVRNGAPLQGADKQRYLGWRGFPDPQSVWLDDFGIPTGTAGGQGDLRPAPILMPVPFATNGRARARSGWLPLGARHRRSVTAPDGLPRAVVGEGLQFGNAAQPDGWLPFAGGRLTAWNAPAMLPAPLPVTGSDLDTTTFGRPVYVLTLGASLPAGDPDRYAGCIAELGHPTGSRFGWLRVVGHRGDRLFLATDQALPGGVLTVQLRGWFAELATAPPDVYAGHDLVPLPRANVRLGFAFHRAPDRALESGEDPDRFPATAGTFVTDLADPATGQALRTFGPTHLMWDALLDGEYRRTPLDQPPPADPRSAIALRRLWLPVRF